MSGLSSRRPCGSKEGSRTVHLDLVLPLLVSRLLDQSPVSRLVRLPYPDSTKILHMLVCTRSLYYYMAGVKKGHSLSDAYATIQGSVVNIAGTPLYYYSPLTKPEAVLS